MRLWTIQTKAVFNTLQETGTYICNPDLSICLAELDFYIPYNWLCNQMEKRIGKRPANIKYPVWAWHTLYGRHSKPDLRWTEFRHLESDSVCMEIEIPDGQVLLSNEEDWHYVLNDWFNTKYKSELTFEQAEEWFQKLSDHQKRIEKEKSWEYIFDVKDCPFIQATFWELKKENIVNIRYIRHRKNTSHHC